MPQSIDLKALFTDPKRRKGLLIAAAVGGGVGLFVLYRNRGKVSLPASTANEDYNVSPGGPLGGAGGFEDSAAPTGADTAGSTGVDGGFFDQLLAVLGQQQAQLQTDLASGLESLYSNQQVLSDQLASVASLGGGAGSGEVYYAPAPSSYDYAAAGAYQPQAGDFGLVDGVGGQVPYTPQTGFTAQGDTGPATTGLADSLFNTGAFQGSTPTKSPGKSLADFVQTNAFASLVNQPVKQFAIAPAKSTGPTAAAPIMGYTPAGTLGSKQTTIQQAQVKPATIFQSGKQTQPAPSYVTVVRSLSTPPKQSAVPAKTITSREKIPVNKTVRRDAP